MSQRIFNPVRSFTCSLLVLLSGALTVHACLWDSDTLEMERQRFPGVLEVIAGKVLRHSADFYEWRVRDRQEKLKTQPNQPQWMDDLGVALDKLGRHEEAIAVARQAESLYPRRYETLANLGTFLVHAGRLEEGLPYLKEAVKVNPQAHFGREIYQIALIEYLLERSAGHRTSGALPIRLPLQPGAEILAKTETGADPLDDVGPAFGGEWSNFAMWLKEKGLGADQKAAIDGVCGMMVFSRDDSPILLEALGDLLIANQYEQQLAARAYLRAGQQTDGEARKAYEALAAWALDSQRHIDVEKLKPQLEAELKEGREFQAQIAADERAWIAEGLDPEQAFAAKYYAAPAIGGPGWVRWARELPLHLARPLNWLLGVLGVGGILCVIAVVRIIRQLLHFLTKER